MEPWPRWRSGWVSGVGNSPPPPTSSLGTAKSTALYRSYGNALVGRSENAQAAIAFSKAVTLTPQDPELYLLHADAAFVMLDFPAGIASLDQAVALDRRYAKYWENMGDNLSSTGQTSDAMAAYERCLLSLPEEIGLIKKIGDCYLAMEQVEAAQTAYRIYLKKASSGNA